MNDADKSQPETHSELERVRAYLKEHPAFFRDNTDVLEQLDVPHDGGGTSLLEYQVSVLRDKNQGMSRKLRDYHAAAEHNATLLEKIHGLYGLMLAADDRQQLAKQITERLRQEFGCDAVAIALFDAELFSGTGVVSLASQPAMEAFASLREEPQAACGRFNRRKLEFLFGERAEALRSAALAPLDESGDMGLLALGSSDEHKFQPGMGTLFIELLARMLGESIVHRLGPADTAADGG